TAETEVDRLKARLDHPWKRWKIGPDDFRNLEKREAYLAALRDMFGHTNTRWAPWHAIDGNNKKAARIASLKVIADQLERSVPMEPPPPSKALEELARNVFGDRETDQPG